MIQGDIRTLSEDKINDLLQDDEVDLIIGGPPCQSFSTVGMRRFDEQAKLYKEYLRLLSIIKPKMFLFENVTGILSMREIFYKIDAMGELRYEEIKTIRGGKEIVRRKPIVDHYGDLIMDMISNQFNLVGYNFQYAVLNAVDFGVPQNRERVFIIGIRNDLPLEWRFPQKTCKRPITVEEAISDLPGLREGEKISTYFGSPITEYQKIMRGDEQRLTCHFCGVYGKKIRTVIENVKQGQGKDDFNQLIDNGVLPEEFRLTSGYKNTYGRLIQNKPSTTITNNMCTPSGLRCIHYAQNRALSPREGARIQSFPDFFKFSGTRTDITKQIGNAVPPLLSMSIAEQINLTLGEK